MSVPKEWIEVFKEEDKKKFYYIVGVRRKVGADFKFEFGCDAVILYHSGHVSAAKLAKNMIENKMTPMTPIEAVTAVGLSELNSILNAYELRVRFNPDITVHKFVTETQWESKWFEDYIKFAGKCEDVRKKLVESQIKF